MKPLYHLLVTACLLLVIIIASGQDKAGTKTTNFDFFAKGENSYTYREVAYYGSMKTFFNGQSTGRSNRTYIDLEYNHWFGGGLGAGLSINADWSGTHNNNTDQLSRNWTISPSLSYGKTLNDHLGVYARAELTFGNNKYIYKNPPINTTDKSDVFGYDGTVAFPYRFSKYTALTTALSYNFLQDKTDASKDKNNSYGLSIFMEDYLRCNQVKCDHSTGFKLSQHAFDQGHGFINYDTRGSLFFGNNITTYTGLPTSNKNKFNNENLDLSGSYYFIDHAAIGGGLGFSHSVQKSDDNSLRYTSNFFEFDPEATINAPVNNGWRNLFIKGGGYFGSNKTEVKSTGSTTTNKSSTSGFNAGIGYYLFYTAETALKTCIYYDSVTSKDKDSNGKSKRRGLGISLGLSHSF